MRMTKIQAQAAASALGGAFPGLLIEVEEPTGMGPDNFVSIAVSKAATPRDRSIAYDMFEAGEYARYLGDVR